MHPERMGRTVVAKRRGVLLTAAVLVLVWGTLVSGPFRVFAEMVRDAAAAAAALAGLSGFLLAAAVHLAAAAAMAGLLLAVRTLRGELVAGICATTGAVYHMFGRLSDQTFTSVSTAVLIGLAVVLACLAFRIHAATLWLGDAFAASLAVMLLYDAAILPVMARFSVPVGWMPGWMQIGTFSLVGSSVMPAGLPAWIAGVVLAAGSAAAFVVFSRRKGGSKG
jgi:hypothetical protein